MLNRFDLEVAKKYNYVKDCPEHQIITLMESSGVAVRPAFFNYWVRSDAFLVRCIQSQACHTRYHSFDLFDNLRRVYGMSNEEGNSSLWGYNIDQIRQRFGLPIMLSCDSYYLPYSKNYNSSHLGTRVIVLDHDEINGRYRIGEAPFLVDDWVDREFLSFAHGAQQSARGYYHIPRLPNHPVLLMSAAELYEESRAAASQTRDRGSYNSDIKLWCEMAMEPNHLTLVLECLMHMVASWMNLKSFMEWLIEESGAEIKLATQLEGAKQVISSWQRLQMDVVKLQRKRQTDAASVLESRLLEVLTKETMLVDTF
jgi:hypothetical protein